MKAPTNPPVPTSPVVARTPDRDTELAVPAPRVGLAQGTTLSALGTLFWLTVRQYCRGRRLLILGFLFLLPSIGAVAARYSDPDIPLNGIEFGMIFNLIPHALIPLTALLYACGMIQDELEDQTLTYLFIRPLPKWAIYVTKLLATVPVTCCLAGVFTLLTFLVIHWGSADAWSAGLPVRALKTVALQALALLGYCSLFGFLSLFVRRSLVVGIAYIIVFEGVLANIDFVVRRLTIMYYFRILALRWIGFDWYSINKDGVDEWGIDLSKAPAAWSCVVTLLAVSLVATILAALIFATREFRLKTPEGS
jgi:ABC-2 type transport system permease protein